MAAQRHGGEGCGQAVGRDHALPCLHTEGLAGMHVLPLKKAGGALERWELSPVARVGSHQDTQQPPGTAVVGNHRKFPVCSGPVRIFWPTGFHSEVHWDSLALLHAEP